MVKKDSGHARKIGDWGEGEAVNYLTTQNVTIIARNVRTQFGEIDILGLEDDIYIFFEVKARLTREFGYPEIAVDKNKAMRMINSALDYLQSHPEIQNEWRIDVIAITKFGNRPHEIKWFRNAISG
jgi:putative endonuclease